MAAVVARGWGWRHATRPRFAISGLDLEITPGERVLLLGASGSGKSTLLAGLAGVLGGTDEGDQQGELLVAGAPAQQRRAPVGLVLQDPQSNTILSEVGDDVAFGCENAGVPPAEIWQRVDAALAAVGLQLPRAWPTAELSGGQRQRLALAGVLAMGPKLLLLDEPTANLDPEGVLEVRDAVARVVAEQQLTCVVVEHRVSTWQPVIDRVVVLQAGGGLLADGPPGQVFADHGKQLERLGIWLPRQPPARRSPRVFGPPQLSAEELVPGYQRPAHSPLSFTLARGTATMITGPNGAGKTALALTLAGLLPPISGAVRAAPSLRGGLSANPARWRSRELVPRIQLVFQSPSHQFVTARLADEIAVGLRVSNYPEREIIGRVNRLLEELRLSELAEANPFTLSGGEQRRAAVATALATAPQVLILDEPTFGQDRHTWAELVRLINGLVDQDGCTVAAITHDQDFVAAVGDQTIRQELHALA